jgi:hypothetical protein
MSDRVGTNVWHRDDWFIFLYFLARWFAGGLQDVRLDGRFDVNVGTAGVFFAKFENILSFLGCIGTNGY